MPHTTLAEFETHRRRLRALAYRMLGSCSEADDVVQDAWLRWECVDHASVLDPLAYLCRTTTHLCLDQLQAARYRREHYVGLWLPEPIVDEAHDSLGACSPEAELGRYQQLSLGFMLALQQLSPLERAAFVLHDVFDQSFDEVAQTLARSSQACRQLASRARKRLQVLGHGPNTPTEPLANPQAQALLEAFAEALNSGKVDTLAGLLAQDVRLCSDGGGFVHALPTPLLGRDRVAQALLSFARVWQRDVGTLTLCPARVNTGLGALLWNTQGRLEQVCGLECNGTGQVSAIYLQRNPQKLALIARRS
ncbi:MAG: RNA polymerase sigma factor SigJ [Hydrogenophaga sp.]|uniref:RNA polymerase sigma factor SigJ n=1 Tax=Hydrogenophaga sp. TaxID=1904254 RepID=UPI002AB9D224|nr:RNA polymerase sigma factor SigJ [Hydrogenophaga sp.]MDZ4190314.1 RNA polymerase sigma factor SigJ [Hydrogenophaga sp.]